MTAWNGNGYTRPTEWSFSLNYPRAPKGLNLNDRPHWTVKHASTSEVRNTVFINVRSLRIPALDRVRVNVEWVVRDARRRDTDNLAPFLKAIYDGIGADRGISARIVEDDAPEYMDKPGATIRLDRTTPTAHFVVTITALEANG